MVDFDSYSALDVLGSGVIAFALFLLILFPIAGVILMAAGFFLTQAARDRLYETTGHRFSQTGVAIIFISLAITSYGFVDYTLNQPSDVDGEASGQVTDMEFAAEGTNTTNSTTSLAVTWNAGTKDAIDPDEDDSREYRAEDGNKFVLAKLEIENTGSGPIDLTPRLFRVLVDGVEYDHRGLIGSSQGGLSSVTVRPGATYDGWLAFSVPDSSTSATFIVNQDTYTEDGPSVTWTRDSSIVIDIGG